MRNNLIKKIPGISLVVLSILLSAFSVYAQQFNNEWINYNNTYYKFKVGKDSLYQIPVETLQANGLGAVPAEQFRLFRNGVEVPLYTSVPSGPLPPGGYIEFLGKANDGVPDKPLYRQPNYQHVTNYNLHYDTAIYFLTVQTGTINKRFRDVANDVAANVLPVEPYFMHKTGKWFKEQINPGLALDAGTLIYSSSYDLGEFWSSYNINERQTRAEVFSNLKAVSTGPDVVLNYGAFGKSIRTRRIRASVNGTPVQETAMNFFTDKLSTVSFPASMLSTGTAVIGFMNVQPPPTATDDFSDRMVLSYFEFIYAREFDFNNADHFYFELKPSAQGYYLEIKNFNITGSTPVLYDTETLERYVADTNVPGLLRFALKGSAATRKLSLVRQGAGYPVIVGSMTEKKFIDLNSTANQGNYLIISNPKLYTGTNGNNPVEDYRAYRSSAAGGGFNAKVFEIGELTDQFAFGIKGHPLAIKNFISFARQKFSSPVSKAFLIGKGVSYTNYRYVSNFVGPAFTELSRLDEQNILPTYGYPASDNMLSSASPSSPIALTDIGRLSVIYGYEVENYLEKVKEYELHQKTLPHTVDGRLWMKNTLEVTGASDAGLATFLCNSMSAYKTIMEDTLTGSKVTLSCKSIGSEGSQIGTQAIRSLFEEGLSLVTYFGHSSANTIEFNLEGPEAYNVQGKYPVFSVNGCYAGDNFRFTTQRFFDLETLSEKYMLTRQKGCIAFLASTHYGEGVNLSNYLNKFFNRLSKLDYGLPVSRINIDALDDVIKGYAVPPFLARTHAEQINLHGDPAIVMNFQAKPDYVTEESLIELKSSFISVSERSFKVKLKLFNMGRTTRDSILVDVKRVRPDGSIITLYNQKRAPVIYADSLIFELPIVATLDRGQGKIIVTLDGFAQIDEMYEGNNTATKTFFIYENEATPVYPYQYAIVSDARQKFYASTADPFSPQKEYLFEIDSSALFNSPLKKSIIGIYSGGLLEFDPQMPFRDSTVYYWRTAVKSSSAETVLWKVSSFQFILNGPKGFAQAHFYQHTNSGQNQIYLDSVSRQWIFREKLNDLVMRNGVFPTAANQAHDFTVIHNSISDINSVCGISNVIFNVFDPINFLPWLNALPGDPSQYGSDPVCAGDRKYNFQFNILDINKRKSALDFLNLIPPGYYVVFRNTSGIDPASNTYAKDWKADTTVFGAGNSLYHKLEEQGVVTDSFYFPRSFLFAFRKDMKHQFTPVSKFSEGIYDRISLATDCPTDFTEGTVLSPEFGPAKAWKRLTWNGKSNEQPVADIPSISLIGITQAGGEVELKTLGLSSQDVDISDIDARQYPFLKLSLHCRDTVKATPYQLNFWRVVYDPAPEGALAPNIFFTSKDTIELGEPLNFGIAFKNVSEINFDSLKLKVILTDKNNVPKEIPFGLLKPVQHGDTVVFRYTIDTKSLPGLNTIFVEFNPDNHQPEQYHFNNFLYRNFYARYDKQDPVLDVTFDGSHILNGDIVSGRPFIQIKLKDESKFRLLKDTSVMKLWVKFPDGTRRSYRYDSDTVRFIPAIDGSDNTATIEFRPSFLQSFREDGIDNYELIVSAQDASNNPAGKIDYNISFLVINKPMISNLLNYPNPFTTSTAFVFTITGSEIPDNFKIQVLTVTGKIVREITKDELGPLRIGRNITEFKWDGTDQYGQRLGNGVYLYRVISTLHGKEMDKYRAEKDNTDKFFTRGYGKMYLMR